MANAFFGQCDPSGLSLLRLGGGLLWILPGEESLSPESYRSAAV